MKITKTPQPPTKSEDNVWLMPPCGSVYHPKPNQVLKLEFIKYEGEDKPPTYYYTLHSPLDIEK